MDPAFPTCAACGAALTPEDGRHIFTTPDRPVTENPPIKLGQLCAGCMSTMTTSQKLALHVSLMTTAARRAAGDPGAAA